MRSPELKLALKIALFVLLPVAVLVLGLLSGDKWYFTATSVLAVVYLLLMSFGYGISFLLCALFGLTYGAASIYTGLYAGAVYHIAVLATIGLYRFITANKPHSSVVRALKPLGWLICLIAVAAAITGLYFVLKLIGGTQPLLDAATLAISVVTAFLMLKNYREMWLFNLFSSLLYVALWTVQVITTGSGMATVALQSIGTVISIIGFVNWLRQSKRTNAQEEIN